MFSPLLDIVSLYIYGFKCVFKNRFIFYEYMFNISLVFEYINNYNYD